MELTLGPVLFEWKRDDLLRFYDEVAGMPLERVYIGEVVCSKKKGLTAADMEKVGRMLEAAGKEVVVSTLAVISNEEELSLAREMAGLPFAIEANDMSVVSMAAEAKKDVFAGPHIKAYNARAVEFLAGAGVKGVTFPVELPRDSIRHAIENTGVRAEVFAHGRLPLAFSWRCYTSRAFGLTKGGCRHDCARFPDGMEVKTLDGDELFTVNGTSVLSTKTMTLIEFTGDLRDIGVAALRISPDSMHTGEVARLFRKRLDGGISPDEARAGVEEVYGCAEGGDEGFVNGWYLGRPGNLYAAAEAAGHDAYI